MYAIKIYNADFSTPLTTLFYSQDVYNFKYSSEINKPGGSSFTINVLNSKATTTNLRMFNKIIIERDGVGVFIGYIENIKATVNTIDISCIGMLGLFNKRLITASYSTSLSNVIFGILSDTNASDDTGITAGTSDIVKTVNNMAFSRSTVLDAWLKMANFGGGEIEITSAKVLNFFNRLGEDKSDSVVLQYQINQINTANLRDFNVEVQGKDMINKLTGIRNGGTTNTQSDATSIANFGLLEKQMNFSQTYNDTDLESEVLNYIENHKIEFYAPKMVVNEEKIDIDTLNLGDTVKVKLNNGFMALELNERIIKREVKVSDNLTEELILGLMPETSNLLPSSFLDDIINISKRVSLLESEL